MLARLVKSTEPDVSQSQVAPWLATVLYPLARRVVLPGYFGRMTITGQEYLPRTGPVILAPTHRSRWDAVVVPALTGRPVTGRDPYFMVSADEMTGIQGWIIRRFGGFPVNTLQPGIAPLRYAVELLQASKMIVIFPEGNIFRDRTLQCLKPGLARLAIQAESSCPGLGVQIVPLWLDYGQPYPQWGCDLTARFGPALSVANCCPQKSTKTRAQVLTHALQSALEILADH